MEIVDHKVELITFTPNIGEVIEFATRTCYASHDRIGEGTAENLYNQVVKQNHHDSVSEHGIVTFLITTTRDVLAQITRHRIASYSVQSQRYCNYSKDKFGGVSFIQPLSIEVDSSVYYYWLDAMRDAVLAYERLLNRGCKPEVARSVLPNATATDLVMTINVRSLRNFLSLRLDNHAQAEIRYVAKLMVKALQQSDFPNYLIEDVLPKGWDD